jgi:leader peptidase (prepilin peptidase)/N-methyltransferase
MVLVAALLGVVLGAGVGWATNRLNLSLAAAEPEATEPPLPREELWAPLLDAVLLGLTGLRFGFTVTGVTIAVLVVLLVQIFVFDARHRLILNKVIYPAIVIAFLVVPFNPLLQGDLRERYLSAVFGALLAGGMFFILVVVSRGGIGLGDAKLTFFLGAVFGLFPFPALPVLRVLLYGVVIGGIAGVVLLASRSKGMKDYIAYGPFLCCGAFLALMFPCGLLGPATCA